MIVSHRHRFVFLKTTKTAGTSVEVFLARLAGEDAVVTPLCPGEPGHRPRNYRNAKAGSDYPPHARAAFARTRLGASTWDRYFKFCFERNPWDKVVSRYWWHFRDASAPPPVDEFVCNDPRALRSDWPIYSIGDEPAVDAIGRYEVLEQDLRSILTRLGLDVAIELPLAKSVPRPRAGGECLADESAEMIERAFHREIALLGYQRPKRSTSADGDLPAAVK